MCSTKGACVWDIIKALVLENWTQAADGKTEKQHAWRHEVDVVPYSPGRRSSVGKAQAVARPRTFRAGRRPFLTDLGLRGQAMAEPYSGGLIAHLELGRCWWCKDCTVCPCPSFEQQRRPPFSSPFIRTIIETGNETAKFLRHLRIR